jgi:hypothetical protein
MSYLNAYGKKRKISRRWCGSAAAQVQAGPEQGGGGQEEEILALAQATVGGDQAAAAQLGAMLAPMILQEVQAGGGGGEKWPLKKHNQYLERWKICRDNKAISLSIP